MSSFSWSLIIDHSVGKGGELGVWCLCLLPLCVDTLTLLDAKEWIQGVVSWCSDQQRPFVEWFMAVVYGVWGLVCGIRPVSGGPAVLCVTSGWRCEGLWLLHSG